MTTDTKMRLEILCEAELHEEHLCYIVAQGLHLSDALAYEALIDEPRFQCAHCGRTARSRKNLCVPIDLQPGPARPSSH